MESPKDSGVTLQDIAAHLDVSATTVSRSLRQDPLIHPETRARVNEVAERLGYKVRMRRPRRSDKPKPQKSALGLLLRATSLARAQQDQNIMQMMTGVMAVTDGSGMVVTIHTIRYDEQGHMAEDEEAIPTMIRDGVCQAVIAHGPQDERDIAFIAERMPVVSMGRIYRDAPADAVVANNVEGVRGLVDHLVGLGHRRLAWVSGDYEASFLEARQAGFLQGCLSHGLKLQEQRFFGPEIYNPHNHNMEDKQAVLAAAESGTTAFVCGNDLIAFKLIEVLEAGGYRVPAEVSVTGFDASEQPVAGRRLTSVDPQFFEIGQAAARLAIQRITEPVGEPLIISVRSKSVFGETTAPPPSNAGAASS